MTTDVVIAGGGPVGLLLACELRLRDVAVLVLERLTEPDETIKAGFLSGRSADAFDRRGMFGPLEEIHQTVMARFLANGPGGGGAVSKGHFAGIFKVGFTPDELPEALTVLNAAPRGLLAAGRLGLRSAQSPPAVVPQFRVERVLAERAVELGVELRRGHQLTGYDQDEAGVTVCVDGPDGGYSVRAGYLVGCDGGRSTVRKYAGFAFPGTEPTFTGHQAVVELDDPGKLARGWHRTGTGLAVYGPTPGRILTVEFDGPPADRDAPVTRAELQASLRRVSGTDVTITSVACATRFTDNTRLADTFRRGRILLAGDAAHVHSPFGGQGLNLGLADAVNLGWKLAAVLAGGAPGDLLDSYTTERHPVAERVLANTRAQVALLRPDEQTGALRDLFIELMDLEQVNWYLLEMMAGTGVRYSTHLPVDAHPLVGRYAPDLPLVGADGVSRLAEAGRDGRAVLLDLVDDPALRDIAAGWSDRVGTVTARCPDADDITALLVRPDGYVAWLATAATPTDPDELRTVLTRWFGPAGSRPGVPDAPRAAQSSA